MALPSPIQAYLSLIYLYLCTFVRRFTNVFITFVYKNTQTIVNRDYLLYMPISSWLSDSKIKN